jgi:hypothetical protein
MRSPGLGAECVYANQLQIRCHLYLRLLELGHDVQILQKTPNSLGRRAALVGLWFRRRFGVWTA